METIYVDKPDATLERIAASLGYSGKKLRLRITDSVTLHSRFWDGGTRSTWSVHRLDDGQSKGLAAIQGFSDPPQFGGLRGDPELPIPPGSVVVEHSIFCGKDHGLTVYLRQADAAPLLPPVCELTHAEAVVLCATAGLKSSYSGRKPRREAAAKHGVDDAAFDTASDALKARGLLNNAGAISAAGRNAVESHPLRRRVS